MRLVPLLLCSRMLAVTATGTGGVIPPGAPLTTSGTFTSDVFFGNTAIVSGGDAVTVTLLGLKHSWAGDLTATLSFIDGEGNVVRTATLFDRVGLNSTTPLGSWAAFGGPFFVGDNYVLNSGNPGDLWAVAAASGSADTIPGQQFDTVNAGQYFTTDSGNVRNSFSSSFAGLDVSSGTWRLTIRDGSDHNSPSTPIANTGALIGWSLDIATDPPSPSDFVLQVTPAVQNIPAGSVATYNVVVSPVSGFTGPINLSVAWLPPGSLASFGTGGFELSCNAASSPLLITVPPQTPPGAYTFTVTAQASSSSHSAGVGLTVLSANVAPSAKRHP